MGMTDLNKTKEILVTGTIPNNSFKFISDIGFSIFHENPVIVWDIGRTTAYVQRWLSWSEKWMVVKKRYQEDWEKRIFIADHLIEGKIKKAS
jgi:hypothetical protein